MVIPDSMKGWDPLDYIFMKLFFSKIYSMRDPIKLFNTFLLLKSIEFYVFLLHKIKSIN